MPTALREVALAVGIPHLGELISNFLSHQLQAPNSHSSGSPDVMDNEAANVPADLHLRCVPSAKATFYSPSDALDSTGLLTEHIRAVDNWMNGHARYDTVFIVQDTEEDEDSEDEDEYGKGFMGLFVGRVRLFFSFRLHGMWYPCVLISEFTTFGDEPCPVTGMWRVTPDTDTVRGGPLFSVRHLDTVLRAAHLIGYGEADSKAKLPWNFGYQNSLDSFQTFYVNKYIDHHAYEIAF